MSENLVADSCKDSRLRLDRRLADAGGREECCRIYKSGFSEFARKILPELNGAAEKSGQNTPDYLHTRQIVVDHLTWLTSNCRGRGTIRGGRKIFRPYDIYPTNLLSRCHKKYLPSGLRSVSATKIIHWASGVERP